MVKKIKLAVIGSPISHSRSPEIHQEFADQAGIDIEFSKVELSKSNLDDWVHSFFLDGGKGLSVTLPFKEDCLSLADKISDRAEITKAINVLYNSKGKILGDCTDGVGLVKDLIVNKNHMAFQQDRVSCIDSRFKKVYDAEAAGLSQPG